MLGFATIRKDGYPDEWLDRNRWRSLIGEFPELRPKEFIVISGEQCAVPDSADYIENGEVVGAFIWEDGQIYVDGPASMFHLAKGIARVLDARVEDDLGDEMFEPPEELDLRVEPQQVSYHNYDEPLDMTGRDLISILDCNKADLVPLVGHMLPKSEMQFSPFPATEITDAYGKLADEVHEWPDATLGQNFRHLVLLFLNDRLVGIKWKFQGISGTTPTARKPRWKFW